MRIKYLENSNGTIFNAIAQKNTNGIECHTILINPLCRFIDNQADSQFLINAITDYSDIIESLTINESPNSELISEQDYVILEVAQSDNDALQFIYSDEFDFEGCDLSKIKDYSIELANILIATLGANEEKIVEYLESEMSEMIKYNYTPLSESVAEVFGVVLNSTEDNNIDLTVRYYCDPEHKKPNNNSILINMLDQLVPKISEYLKTYNFFMVREPITIIKLGLSTSGEYLINTNDVLLNPLEKSTATEVLELLTKTYEIL